jgi:hypothetical protein
LITTTNASGAYSFANLAPGSYNVSFTTPSGLTATVSNSTGAGATDNNDSDPISGVVNGLNLTAGEINNSVDAGFHNACSNTIFGNVWNDISGMTNNRVDSIGSYAALPIPTTIRAILVSVTTGKVVKNTLVSGNGVFQFSNVLPGSYYIQIGQQSGVVGQNPPIIVLPTGWISTGEKFGTGNGRDFIIDGILDIGFSNYECIYNANFGIQFSNDDNPIP